MSKYTVILNKNMSGQIYPVAMVNIDDTINNLYEDYNTIVRDKYDPYSFIEWLENVHSVTVYSISTKTYTKQYDKAYKFNFHNPVVRARRKLKKVINATTSKTIK